MDRRLHDRTPAVFHVRVTLISNPEFSAEGETIEISKSGIGVNLPVHFPFGSLVELEIADSILYGFVAYSLPLPSSGATSLFHTGIEVIEVLIGSSGLSQLLKTVLKETMPNLQITYSGAAPEGK